MNKGTLAVAWIFAFGLAEGIFIPGLNVGLGGGTGGATLVDTNVSPNLPAIGGFVGGALLGAAGASLLGSLANQGGSTGGRGGFTRRRRRKFHRRGRREARFDDSGPTQNNTDDNVDLQQLFEEAKSEECLKKIYCMLSTYKLLKNGYPAVGPNNFEANAPKEVRLRAEFVYRNAVKVGDLFKDPRNCEYAFKCPQIEFEFDA